VFFVVFFQKRLGNFFFLPVYKNYSVVFDPKTTLFRKQKMSVFFKIE